ncbi:hypothetical protein BK126_04340 [Paenibacillus sp. FSL H7-0326]|uniref:hypothetical protein n=1 Tax=Paenibacillus sp. FSL H7-0326 TaxID=1921144 RepID=UPI00096EBEE3|nr:hypothetical protein [Paenibacillus sp. FSL H7-0326]OMC71331.1 hypothetical protein BK126_04340 [Paenibacillus sp. FSL H7-0326]
MAKDIKIIQVSFNVLDPDQRFWHEFVASKTNSSGYIKRLIQRDAEGGGGGAVMLQEEKPVTQSFNVEGWI